MKILSLYSSLPSSVALIENNKVVSAVNEERFTRKKNDEVFPRNAIDFCLKNSSLSGSDLDAVAWGSFITPFDDHLIKKSQWTVDDYLKEQYKRWKPLLVDKTQSHAESVLNIFPEKIDLSQYPKEYWKKYLNNPDRNKIHSSEKKTIIADYLGIDKNKVRCIDHHRCHAAYSYYASNMIGKKVLALTVDGLGDGMNATIGTFDESGLYKRHYQTDKCAIGRIYRYMTLLLGMKPNEHEYKVMGLAPYGKKNYAEGAYKIFEETLKVKGTEFVWNIEPTDSYFWFKERLEGFRFDSIAWALQTWTENLILEWTQNCIEKYKIRNLVYSGGVAMNIKAMGKISNLKCVDNLFVGGSASDESIAVSAGICLAEDLSRENKKEWSSSNFSRIKTLYLGPKADANEELKLIKKIDKKNYLIEEDTSALKIAEYLNKGFIIGRCVGRMEFGQRSLGNRSILADPRNIATKERINKAIKNRDFWMPFAPIILDSYEQDYLVNPKKLESPFMTIGFDTTKQGYEAMIAACHPADKSARPQILVKEDNPELYQIIKEFSILSKTGAVLNTSFNLHGFPIVNTSEEAFYVFKNSGLDILLLNNYIIKKNDEV
jgi:carbamoyltransferase